MTLPDLNDSEKLESDTGHQPSLSDTWDTLIKEVISRWLTWVKVKNFFLKSEGQSIISLTELTVISNLLFVAHQFVIVKY